MGVPVDRVAKGADRGEAVAELREVAGRVAPVALAGDQRLPLASSVAPLFPGGGLRRGTVVGITGQAGGIGSTSLALAVLAGPSAAGSWTAIVGLGALGGLAAAEQGIDLGRLALVPEPGKAWPTVVAALLDAIDVVAVAPHGRLRAADARRLSARARERGSVLVVVGRGWCDGPAPDVQLQVAGASWSGLGRGHGVLAGRRLEVVAGGRGAAARPRRVTIGLGPTA
ncbi:MAG: hypothetical protein KY454_13070 [Actinobacteria bacterium]|nr:hypothetical protein [Actinomycetota bacterium]MBW3650993.1 hypothetical protein [Actinomycetota bacterium]